MSRALPLVLVLAPLAAAQDPIFLSPHVPTSFQPKAVSSGDLNGDGASDVLLTRNDGSFDLHLGLGDGGFLAPLHTAVGREGLVGVERVEPDAAVAA